MSTEGQRFYTHLCVPHVTVVVVIPGKQVLAGLGEVHRGDTAQDFLVGVFADLGHRAGIEQAAGRVVRTRTEGFAVREELNGVDIRFMTSERQLGARTVTDIPQLRVGIAGARHESL